MKQRFSEAEFVTFYLLCGTAELTLGNGCKFNELREHGLGR